MDSEQQARELKEYKRRVGALRNALSEAQGVLAKALELDAERPAEGENVTGVNREPEA